MEDVLEGIVLPGWGVGSVLLLLAIIVLSVFVIITVVESVRWFASRSRGGIRTEDIWKVSLFILLVLLTVNRGYLYYLPLVRWVGCIMRVSSTPSWEVLQDGMLIQGSIWSEFFRCLSHSVLYGISYLLIRKDRRG